MKKEASTPGILFIAGLFCLLIIIWLVKNQKPGNKTLSSQNFVCTNVFENLKSADSGIAWLETEKEFKFIGDERYFWRNKKKLKVFFWENNVEAARKVLNIANEWYSYTGIRLEKTDTMLYSDIRVSFVELGYSSSVGSEAINHFGETTMALHGLDTMTDKAEMKRIVLHEFGHALGLMHEHQRPGLSIPWDTPAVYKFYYDHFKWARDCVDQFVFKPFYGYACNDFDPKSIMIYAVPDTLTKGNFEIRWPDDLSSNDKICAKKVYQ
ncbi:MAG: M12 family metallopeptidase [Bacteroidia bacterium]